MTSRISDAVPIERSDDETSTDLGESLQQWSRVVRALQRQKDGDIARRWLRARAIDVAVHSIRSSVAAAHAKDLEELARAVQDLLDEIEPSLPVARLDELGRCLELRWERDRIAQKRDDARSLLAKTFAERSQRRAREWFAEGLPVQSARGEPIPTVDSIASAERALAAAEARRAAAEAASPPRPEKAVQESLSDWSAPSPSNERPAEAEAIEQNARAGREALRHLPPAGPEPMWVEARDIPFAFRAAEITWWGSLAVAVLTTAIVTLGVIMTGRGGEEAGLWRSMGFLAGATWFVVVLGYLAKRVLDALLWRKHTDWLERCAAIDRAHRAVGWAYVVARAEVEQAAAEAHALSEFIAASRRLDEFDGDPELGGKLESLRGESGELGGHVDAASVVLRWATPKGWERE